MAKLTKKQVLEIEKAQKLILQANDLLMKNLAKFDYDNIVSQTLSRSKNLVSAMPNLLEIINDEL